MYLYLRACSLESALTTEAKDVAEMLGNFILIRLIATEDFIGLLRRENFNYYVLLTATFMNNSQLLKYIFIGRQRQERTGMIIL
jgi:hypothetical protein